MSEKQIIFFVCIFAVVTRIPRILERWKAPLLRGPEWFFNVAVADDFLSGPGARILRRYRLRLFLPWAVELPIAAGLLLTGRHSYILLLIFVITLLTRLNYYAARSAAEAEARAFALPGSEVPVAAVALSLRPRTLAQYTKRWVEAVIVLEIIASIVWVGFRYAALRDWGALRAPWSATILGIYLQAGLLLIKRGVVRARTAAPADNAEQYLAWRDSLRRLTTAICDYIRIFVASIPLLVELQSVTVPWQGSTAQAATLVVVLAATLAATWYEWRYRWRYLEVARRTRPAKFLLTPDLNDARGVICFRPSLPMLLLSRPNGYTLNLASVSARIAGAWLAGYAALLVYLNR